MSEKRINEEIIRKVKLKYKEVKCKKHKDVTYVKMFSNLIIFYFKNKQDRKGT